MSFGFQKREKQKEAGYFDLTDIQKCFYDEAEQEFEEIKLRISNATKKSQLSKVRERTIVKDRLAEKVSKKLGKTVNHSHASKQNNPFLFDRINRWNEQLKAQYAVCALSSETFQTKDEIKRDLEGVKRQINDQQKEIDIAELNFLADALLLPAQSELKNKIAMLEGDNKKLHEKVVTLEFQREEYLKQIVSDIEVKRIKQENIKLRTLLAEHGIEVK